MTDEQLLAMMREEKQAHRTAKQLRATDRVASQIESEHAWDLTCKIDRAHQEMGV